MGRQWDCRWGERMALRCKGCGSGEHVKNGFMRGKQRYRCKACGLNFTDTPPARHAAAGQGGGGAAVPERAVDEPHRQAARGVDAQRPGLDRALRRSVRPEARARGPRRRGRAGRDVALPKKKSNKLWVWKARDRATGRLIDWELGGRDAATLERMLERLK